MKKSIFAAFVVAGVVSMSAFSQPAKAGVPDVPITASTKNKSYDTTPIVLYGLFNPKGDQKTSPNPGPGQAFPVPCGKVLQGWTLRFEVSALNAFDRKDKKPSMVEVSLDGGKTWKLTEDGKVSYDLGSSSAKRYAVCFRIRYTGGRQNKVMGFSFLKFTYKSGNTEDTMAYSQIVDLIRYSGMAKGRAISEWQEERIDALKSGIVYYGDDDEEETQVSEVSESNNITSTPRTIVTEPVDGEVPMLDDLAPQKTTLTFLSEKGSIGGAKATDLQVFRFPKGASHIVLDFTFVSGKKGHKGPMTDSSPVRFETKSMKDFVITFTTSEGVVKTVTYRNKVR